MSMAKTKKIVDSSVEIAAELLEKLNPGKVRIEKTGLSGFVEKIIMTNVRPMDLVYPEGWYYAEGCFRNKHNSASGMYYEMLMIKGDGSFWEDIYCDSDDDDLED